MERLRSDLLVGLYADQKKLLLAAVDMAHIHLETAKQANEKNLACLIEYRSEIQKLQTQIVCLTGINHNDDHCCVEEDEGGGDVYLKMEEEEAIQKQLELVMMEVNQYYRNFIIPFESWRQAKIVPHMVKLIRKMMASDEVLLDAHMSIYRTISDHFHHITL